MHRKGALASSPPPAQQGEARQRRRRSGKVADPPDGRAGRQTASNPAARERYQMGDWLSRQRDL
ncbi:MAG: hypothetical protein QME16_07020 [Planctomycetota bacterium]|nr:hypothetical protein [Planctomycetota bacterium]